MDASSKMVVQEETDKEKQGIILIIKTSNTHDRQVFNERTSP